MEKTVLSPAEALEFEEFRRNQRAVEVKVRLKKFLIDASRRETDRAALQRAAAAAKKFGAGGLLVSPVNLVLARRYLEGSGIPVVCLIGGTGESVTSVKKIEAKKAIARGAKELRLVLCYSALFSRNFAYLKKEIRKVRKLKKPVTVSLEDRALSAEDIALGVRAAREARADGVCVRGDLSVLLAATKTAGALKIETAGVENAEQLNSMLRAGASRAATNCIEKIAGELYAEADAAASAESESKTQT